MNDSSGRNFAHKVSFTQKLIELFVGKTTNQSAKKGQEEVNLIQEREGAQGVLRGLDRIELLNNLLRQSQSATLRKLQNPIMLPDGQTTTQIAVSRYSAFLQGGGQLHIVSFFFCDGPTVVEQKSYQLFYEFDEFGEVTVVDEPDTEWRGDIMVKTPHEYHPAEGDYWKFNSLVEMADDYMKLALRGKSLPLPKHHALNRPVQVRGVGGASHDQLER